MELNPQSLRGMPVYGISRCLKSICESAVFSIKISVSNKLPVRLKERGRGSGDGSGQRGVAVEWRGYPFIPSSASGGVQAGEGPGHVSISE